MYVPTSMPFVSRTRAIFRSAEFGFLGVIVDTRVQTPRFCGAPWRAGVLVFSRLVSRPLRISWLTVGMNPFGAEKVVYRRKAGGAVSPAAPGAHGSKGRLAGSAPFSDARRGWNTSRIVLEIAVPAAALVVFAVAFALWTRATAAARIEAAVRDLSAGLGRESELAASLDPEEVAGRVLAAAAALPGADAALLILDGEAEAVGLSEQEAERAALETPPN